MSDQPNDRELAWRVWGMAWPTVLHGLLETSMGTVDLVMVRPLGPDATAAVGIGRQVTFLVAAAAIAISTGVITLVSQSVGAGDRQRVRQIIWQSLALVLLLGLATGSLGFILVGPLLVAMRASIATIALGTGYLHVYFGGIVLVWANFVLAAVFRGAGDARTPLRLGIVVNLVNVGLNYALIFGLGPIPAFGVTGAALATVIARGIGVSAYLFLLLPRVEWLAPDGIGRAVWDARTAKNVIRVGAPLAVAAVLRNSSRLVFLAIVGGGTAALTAQAAVGVGMQVRLIGILPALAFQTATAALVGQAIGRGAIPEAESLARQGLLLLGLLMGVITSALFVVAGPLAWLFVTEADLAGLTSTVIRWFAVAQLFSALAICTQGALNGGGDTRPAARYTLVSQWCLMLPLAAVLALPLGWGLNGALVAWVLAPALNFALTWRRFRLGIWKGAGS